MQTTEACCIASDIYACAGLAPLDYPGQVGLAVALLGPDGVCLVGGERRRPISPANVARLVWHVSRWELHLARASAPVETSAAASTALAQWYRTVHRPELAASSDAIVARHLLLHDDVLAVFADERRMGRDEIARRFHTTEDVVATRISEMRASRLANSGTIRVAPAYLRLLA